MISFFKKCLNHSYIVFTFPNGIVCVGGKGESANNFSPKLNLFAVDFYIYLRIKVYIRGTGTRRKQVLAPLDA